MVAIGYHHKFVCDQIQKVRGIDREILLTRDTEPFSVTYQPCLPNIGGFLEGIASTPLIVRQVQSSSPSCPACREEKRSYNINYQLDCNSNNVVYLINCKVCGLQYVGSTSTKFRLRFNNRKSRLRAHSRKSNIDKESDDFVYKDFHGPGHHGLRVVSVQIIDKVHNNEKLFIKERESAYRLQRLKAEGLNDSDSFYSQNRVTRNR